MDFREIINKFVYRIEPKAGGGFVATCRDSSLPPIEGATRAEVQQKIRDRINESIASEFPALKPILENQQVNLHYHVEAKPGGGYIVHHGDPSRDSIEGSTRDHLESLIESKLFSTLIDKLPPELHQQITNRLNSGGLDITVNRQISITDKSGTPIDLSADNVPSFDAPGATQAAVLSGKEQPAATDAINQSPITYEKSNTGTFFRLLFVLVILAAILYFFIHRF